MFCLKLCMKMECLSWNHLFRPTQEWVDWFRWFPLHPVPVRVVPVRCRCHRLLSATARVSVRKPVPPVIPTTSSVIAVVPAAALARIKAVRVIQLPVVRAGLSSIDSPDTVTTMVRVPSRIGYTGWRLIQPNCPVCNFSSQKASIFCSRSRL